MNNLIVKGITEVEGMRFHDIEGGFGADKKAMLAKDIAEIHGKEIKHINEAINKHRGKFRDGIDIADLKSVDLIDRDLLNQLGFSNSSIANKNYPKNRLLKALVVLFPSSLLLLTLVLSILEAVSHMTLPALRALRLLKMPMVNG